LGICQLHSLLIRAAQISLELHYCVELHTKKSSATRAHSTTSISRLLLLLLLTSATFLPESL